jgi:hypothetical protein
MLELLMEEKVQKPIGGILRILARARQKAAGGREG